MSENTEIFDGTQRQRDTDKKGLSDQSGSLRHDLYGLAQKSLVDQESSPKLASYEYIFDEQNHIVDIRFRQLSASTTLKEVLPGSYTIKTTHYSQKDCDDVPERYGSYQCFEDILSFNECSDPVEQARVNVTLLHEAGHAMDEYTTHALSLDGTVDLLERHVTFRMIELKKEAILQEREIPAEDASILREVIATQTTLPPLEREWLLQWFSTLSATVNQHSTLEELSQFEQAQKKHLLEKMDVLERKHERTAWAHALYALRTLRKKGINLYIGTSVDLFDSIDKALRSRHAFYAMDNTPTPRFTKRSHQR